MARLMTICLTVLINLSCGSSSAVNSIDVLTSKASITGEISGKPWTSKSGYAELKQISADGTKSLVLNFSPFNSSNPCGNTNRKTNSYYALAIFVPDELGTYSSVDDNKFFTFAGLNYFDPILNDNEGMGANFKLDIKEIDSNSVSGSLEVWVDRTGGGTDSNWGKTNIKGSFSVPFCR